MGNKLISVQRRGNWTAVLPWERGVASASALVVSLSLSICWDCVGHTAGADGVEWAERERARKRESGSRQRERVERGGVRGGVALMGEGGCLCFRARREQLDRVKGLESECHGHNMALTVLYVPHSLNSGVSVRIKNCIESTYR